MQVFLRRAVTTVLVLSSLGLSACAHQRQARDPYAYQGSSQGYGSQPYDNAYYRGQGYGGQGSYSQREAYAEVQYGRVQRIEQMQGRRGADTQGGGAIIGGVIGGLIGNQMGKGDGRTAATVAGVVGGALIGNEVERQNQGGRAAFRVTIRLDNRSEQQFDFERLDGLSVGDRVRIENGRVQRW